jgi:peroxiredoxin
LLIRLLIMKKGILLLASVFTLTSVYSQKKSPEKKFSIKVEGTIQNFTGKIVYVTHKLEDKEILDSAKVNNGKFSFSLKNTEPSLYWLSIAGDPTLVFFFADQTPIKASLKADSMAYSSVMGGTVQNEYMEYRGFINGLVATQQKMQADFNIAIQNNDVNTQNAIKAEYQNLNTQYMVGLKNFLKTHPKSPVSAHIIGSDLNNAAIPVSEVIEALSYLDKSLENNSNIIAANKRIDDAKGTMVGYTATNFSQTTPEGKLVSLTDFRGKYVLIDFWASWCRPCRMENPNVVAAYNRYKDKGFTILGVSMDSNKEPWLNAIQQDNLTWTHVSDLKGWGNEVGKIYGVTGIPQNYLIDKDGKIVAKDLRGAALDEKLAEIIK